ncbi:LIG4 [Candida margitis]|uniref:LIG4 n=1 Tax=Candida margitis TaxID=1775924 RepID=UPI002227FEDF|nr:LIG4 [Candida margitis]KAI5954063.1 LIG4 [Candida margitis]
MPCLLDNVQPPPPNNIDPTLTLLANELFDKLDGVNRHNLQEASTITERKAQIINEFITTFRIHIGNDMLLSAKLIFPEKASRLYFIKETALARLIIKMYKIPKDAEEYNLLHYWNRQYQKSKRFAVDERKIRDLPLQAARVIATRRPFIERCKEYTVPKINSILNDLTMAKQSQDQLEILQPLFDNLRIEEIRWFIQFILKKPILIHMEKYFFNSWHPDGYRLYSICNSLEKTFNLLIDPDKRLTREDLGIHPGYKFKPQLAERLTSNYNVAVRKLQKKQPMDPQYEDKFRSLQLEDKFYIEEKMDGDRMLLHKEGNRFKFFSRRLKDYSFLYGESFQFGSLTKYIRDAFANNIESIILDGEMVAYDYKRQAILPFGTLKSSAVQESVRQFTTIDHYELQTSYPYYLIFDILYLNGRDLSNYPLFFRKDLLDRIIKPVPYRFEVHDVRLGSGVADIEKAIREVVTSRSEGLVLKHVQSRYVIGGFRNPNWIKVKPEYLEKFGENLDLVVIGKNPGVKNSYMMGLKNKEGNDSDDGGGGAYYSFCMCANGFEIEEFDKIERLTHGRWINTSQQMPPESLIKFGRKKPDFWIDPQYSLVLEIRARSIDVRPEATFAVGTTLHNMHCRCIREDKSIDECISMQEYFELKQDYMRDLNLKSQAATTNKRDRNKLTDSFNEPSSLIQVKIESDLFASFEFLILSDKHDPFNGGQITTIEELKTLVKQFGGHLVNAIDGKTNLQIIIITEKNLPTSHRYLAQGLDLINPSWIFECIKRQHIVQLESCFIFDSPNWAMYDQRVDKFGDSYTVHLPINDINAPKLTRDEVDQLRNEFEWNESIKPKLYLFEGIAFYVIGKSIASQLVKERIERFSGEVVNDFIQCGYIVVPNYEEKEFRDETLATVKEIYQAINDNLRFTPEGRFIPRIPFTVMEDFIGASIKSNSVVDPDDYKFY